MTLSLYNNNFEYSDLTERVFLEAAVEQELAAAKAQFEEGNLILIF